MQELIRLKMMFTIFDLKEMVSKVGSYECGKKEDTLKKKKKKKGGQEFPLWRSRNESNQEA